MLWQSLVLVIAFGAIFAWQNTSAAQYTVQFLGAAIVLYLLLFARRKGKTFLSAATDGTLAILILTVVMFLLVFATGALNSPLFFLLYFLGFGIAFVFEPPVVFVYILGTIAVFVPEAMKDDIWSNGLRLGSLVLISPLAFFFGKEFRNGEAQDKTIEHMEKTEEKVADDIAKDAIEALETETDPQTITKLNKIIEASEKLRS